MKFVYKALLYLLNWIRKDFQSPKRKTHDFFEEDWDEYEGDYPSHDTRPIQNFSCPQCSHRGSFKIQVKEFLLMFHDYLELDRSEEMEWGANSPCVCPSCSFQGVVSHFQATNEKESAHG